MFEFRVTKYDPAYRRGGVAYTRDEWTSVNDIGRSFGGEIFTDAVYQRTEDAYIAVASAFMQEAGIQSLTVAGLQNHAAVILPFGEGAALSVADAAEVARRVLREEFWCRLEGSGFVHLGYDYYMYLGVPRPCAAAEALAQQFGLFVEPSGPLTPIKSTTNTKALHRIGPSMARGR